MANNVPHHSQCEQDLMKNIYLVHFFASHHQKSYSVLISLLPIILMIGKFVVFMFPMLGQLDMKFITNQQMKMMDIVV